MRVVIAGGHGKVALLLERLLAGRGDHAVGLIRNPAHVADVQRAGAEAVLCDLEAASADDVAVLPMSGWSVLVRAVSSGVRTKPSSRPVIQKLNPRKRRPGSVSAGGYSCVQAVANHLAYALLRVAAQVDWSNREVIG